MSLAGRSLVTMDDLSTEEIEAVFSLAEKLGSDIHGQMDVCHGMVMASLFFEPSTRTRLSFEAAMHRLGGNVIGVSDISIGLALTIIIGFIVALTAMSMLLLAKGVGLKE